MVQVKLLDICDAYQPQTISTKQFVKDGKYLVYGANGVIGRYSEYNHKDTEVVMACRGATCGAINVSSPYSWINGNAMVIHPNGKMPLSKKYLQYFMIFANKNSIISGTAQPQITRQNMKDFTIPICSVESQERIVARIEELFSELDNGVETLKKTKEQLAVYRQTVLNNAFQSVVEKRPIREMSSIVTSGSRGWAKFYDDNGARFIRITDLTRNKICLKNNDIQCVLLPENAEGKRSRLMANDVLVSITADLGSIALVPDAIGEAYINQHIAMIRFNNPMQGKYMAWYLKSDLGQKDLLKNKRGGGKLGLGLDDIRDTPVPIVSDDVAKCTIAYIDSQMSVCDSIEQTVDVALQQAEAMRQSILRTVFEGGLSNV